MPSITYWSRLEPRPRSRSIADNLAARVRDPMWMLARQWQFGEFRGEDAASPAYAQVATRLGRLRSWSADGDEAQPMPDARPLEAVALAEDVIATDLSLAVELGQVFEEALAELDRRDLIGAFRGSYPLAESAADPRDRDASRFIQVAAGRGLQGVDLFLAAEAALPGLPAEPELPSEQDKSDAGAALDQLRTWARDTIGGIGGGDARAWNPARLEYGLTVAGDTPSGGDVSLRARPDRYGGIEWYALDVTGSTVSAETPGGELVQHSVIPANASFRGMPNARWWSFELGVTNLGRIQAERRDVARLIAMDFMLVHSNDWYVMPFRQPLGTMSRIESLVVHDVFGGVTLVERADGASPQTPARPPWTVFSTSVDTGAIADFFVLPPSAGGFALPGVELEEVRFVRDEMANMAWGIERVVQNGVGEPWPSHERSSAATTPDPGPPPEPGVPLSYRIQTPVPQHWIPFVPVVVDLNRREVQLERGVVLQPEGTPSPAPASRILQPTRIDGAYRIDESEVPRDGVKTARIVMRTRWVDGSTHVWIGRRTTLGASEERSGLLFDQAVMVPPTG